MGSTNVTELQIIADKYALKKNLESKGFSILILAVLVIMFGFYYTFVMHYINVVLICLGIVLLYFGLQAYKVTGPKVLLFSGITLILAGAWNVVVFILILIDSISGKGSWFILVPSTLGIFLAALIIIWGIDNINRYSRFKTVSLKDFTAEMSKKIEAIIEPIISSIVMKEQSFVEFNITSGWSFSGQLWKGKLEVPYGVITSARRYDIFFVSPKELEVNRVGGMRSLKSVKQDQFMVSFKIKGFNFKGSIDPVSMERFEVWKKLS
jgi:hypothetical protein